MKAKLLNALPILILLYSCATGSNESAGPKDGKSYQQIHDESIVIDGHNDLLYFVVDKNVSGYTGLESIDFGSDLKGTTHLDLNRQKEGGLDVQIFSVWCPGSQTDPFEMAIRQIDSLESITNRYANEITIATSSEEVAIGIDQGKSIAMIGVEGGHMIESELSNIDSLYKRGARYMTLTWNNSTSWATSSYDEVPDSGVERKGLTAFGKQVVNRMNDLGMMVDISHVGEQTFWDVLEITTKPVIASHSSVYNICPAHRNLKDDQLKAVADNEGVVMVNFYPGYIDSVFWNQEIAFFERHKEESDSLLAIFNNDFWTVEYLLYGKYVDEANEIRPVAPVVGHRLALFHCHSCADVATLVRLLLLVSHS